VSKEKSDRARKGSPIRRESEEVSLFGLYAMWKEKGLRLANSLGTGGSPHKAGWKRSRRYQVIF